MNGRPRHWLNPHYQKSETDTSSCRQTASFHRSSQQSFTSSMTKARMKNILTCLPASWTKMNSLTCSFTSIFTSRSEPKVQKEVVMEGVLPTTKASLMSFLKAMGLRPKVELVGQETIISADMSVINDENLKKKFLEIIKMQVIDSPDTNADSDVSTTNTTNSSRMPSPSKNTEQTHHQRRKSRKSTDILPPGLFKPAKPGEPLPPGLFKTPKTEEADSRASREHHRTSKLSLPHGLFKPRPSGTLPPGPFKTEQQLLEDARKCPRTSDPFTPGAFQPNKQGEPLPPGPCQPRRSTLGSLPPVPWATKKKDQNDQLKSSPSEANDAPGRDVKGNVSFAMHQTPHITKDKPFWDDHPINYSGNIPKVEGNVNNNKKKSKKLRIVKHLRRWVLRTKKVATPCVSVCKVAQNREDSTMKNLGSGRLWREREQEYKGGVGLAQNTKEMFQAHPGRNSNYNTGQRKQAGTTVWEKKPLEVYDGSISMPVLLTPDKSCFKAKIPTQRELGERSKSSTRAGDRLEEEPTTYSVVGNSAAIHLAKNRIRLEGRDAKYGSILHKDKHFDDHFKVLQDNSLQDIEYQVNKVKERIMFARAIDSVGGNKTGDTPEVNLKALLWPEESDSNGKTKKHQVDVVTKSSFYQKFLASMNILKCTNRTDACDRSVMTDEPLSRTYAEFISATAMSEENRPRSSKKPNKAVNEFQNNGDTASMGDSSCELPARGYMAKICQCWEPLLFFKREPTEKNHHRFETCRTEDERIFKCVVNKVIDSSRNKKKGYIKTGISQ